MSDFGDGVLTEGQKPTRENMLSIIGGKEVPIGFMGFGTWTLFAQDYPYEERCGDNICGPRRLGKDRRYLEVDRTKIFPDAFVKEGTVNLVVMEAENCIPTIKTIAGLAYIRI
jgi:hypothetical protein